MTPADHFPGHVMLAAAVIAALCALVVILVLLILRIKLQHATISRHSSFDSIVRTPKPAMKLFPTALCKQQSIELIQPPSRGDDAVTVDRLERGVYGRKRSSQDSGSLRSSMLTRPSTFLLPNDLDVFTKWTVWFSLRYHPDLELLEVTISNVTSAAGESKLSSTEPAFLYFAIQLLPNASKLDAHTSFRRVSCRGEPTFFNEKMHLDLPEHILMSSTLRLTLFVIDSSKIKTCLGFVALPLSKANLGDGSLYRSHSNLERIDSPVGLVTWLATKISEDIAEINDPATLGEVLLGLCYDSCHELLKIEMLNTKNIYCKDQRDSVTDESPKYVMKLDVTIGTSTTSILGEPQPSITSAFVFSCVLRLQPEDLDEAQFTFTILQNRTQPMTCFTTGPGTFLWYGKWHTMRPVQSGFVGRAR